MATYEGSAVIAEADVVCACVSAEGKARPFPAWALEEVKSDIRRRRGRGRQGEEEKGRAADQATSQLEHELE